MKLNEIAGGGKVWALFFDESHEGSTLYGIFSSKAEADKAIKSLIKDQDYPQNPSEDYTIQEIVVNKLINIFFGK